VPVAQPIAEAPRRSASERPSTPVGAPLSGLRILVVDDEEDMRDLVAMLVERAGADVTRASSVFDAVQLAEARPFDLVVSDLAMPDEDGYDLLRRLRGSVHSYARAVPVVAITAYARAEDRRRVMQAGFAQHVPKPVEPGRLVSTLLDVVSPTGRALHMKEVEA
jgi:CheY-like chemotaxis protein